MANWSVCDGVNTLADGEYSDLKYFYELYQGLEDEEVCMSYDELKASGLHYSGAFAQGNVAMMPMGYWYASTLIGYIKDGTASMNWGIVSVPHLEGVAARFFLRLSDRHRHQQRQREQGRGLEVRFLDVLRRRREGDCTDRHPSGVCERGCCRGYGVCGRLPDR